jgi:hypothetical protein
MVVGMIATAAIFVSVVGVKSWDEVTIQYPTQALLAMAVGMTLPMVLWMRYRGMSWRNSGEMAAAMVLPVIPFLCLVWFGVTECAQCGAYSGVMVVAMYALDTGGPNTRTTDSPGEHPQEDADMRVACSDMIREASRPSPLVELAVHLREQW